MTISIIALLLSLLLPSLRSARADAKRVVCSANLKQVGTALWNYWTEQNGRVPYVESPMTNGGAVGPQGPVPGLATPNIPADWLNPFDRDLWPQSLANVLMPSYLGHDERVFVCPAAVNGWAPTGGRYTYTYRPAAANQPNGSVTPEGSYTREHFGFLDGRMLKSLGHALTGNPIKDAQLKTYHRGTYLRDMVRRTSGFEGPHRKGINCLDRRLGVEFRNQQTAADDLVGAPGGAGVQF